MGFVKFQEKWETVCRHSSGKSFYSDRLVIDFKNFLNVKDFWNVLLQCKSKRHNVKITDGKSKYHIECYYNSGGYELEFFETDAAGEGRCWHGKYSNCQLKKFDWFDKHDKKIFGITEIISIMKDISKINRLQIYA